MKGIARGLSCPYAYTLKKPVDLGFLNFTTVERRRADCEEGFV
jgi:aminoglycoside phosphotransferase family enzyme